MPARGYSSTSSDKSAKRKAAPARKQAPNLQADLAKIGETMAKKAGDKKGEAKSRAQREKYEKKPAYKLKPVKAKKQSIVKKAGSIIDLPGDILTPGFQAVESMVRATVDKPGPVLKNTVVGARDIAAAIPAGIVAAATTRPDKTAQKILDDYSKRYGQTPEEQIKRFQKEGLAAELLDASIAVGGQATAVGRPLTKVAAGGALGARAKSVATSTRPALRVTGGEATPQVKSKNYFKAEAQVKLDKTRAKKQAKKAAEVETKAKAMPIHVAESVRRNTAAGKVVEVTPLRARKAKKAQRVMPATDKGRVVQSIKSEQHRVVEKTARRLINQFDKHERKAFAYVGTGTISATKDTVSQLQARRASIVKERLNAGTAQPTGLLKLTDELRTIDYLIEHHDKAFTPRVVDTVRVLKEINDDAARKDPGLDDVDVPARLHAQQAEVLGLRRGEAPPDAPTKKQEASDRVYYRGSEPGGSPPKDTGFPDWDRRLFITHDEKVAKRYGSKIERVAFKKDAKVLMRDTPEYEAVRKRADASPYQAVKVMQQAEKEGWDAVDFKRSEVGTVVINEGAVLRNYDAGIKPLFDPDETPEAFTARVQEAAAKAGLEKPLYFPSEKHALELHPDRASRAAGSGLTASKRDFKYTGKLFREGRQDMTPEVFTTGLSRSIKRKHNWKFVAETFDKHTFEGLRDKKISQLKDEVVARHGDLGDIAFYNPRIHHDALKNIDESADGNQADTRDINLDDETAGANQEAALKASTLTHAEYEANKDLYADSKGWSVIPKGVYNEMEHATKSAGATGRSWDIAKAKQGRIMLGTLNIPWLGFQVASNVLLAATATKGRLPVALAQQHKWYKNLDPESRDHVDALVGESSGNSVGGQAKLGAAANNQLVNQYRALKANPIWDRPIVKHGPSTRQLNPIEAMFALDRAQNTAFRRAVLLDSMKHDAATNMAHHIDGARGLQDRVTKAISGEPKDVLARIVKDKDVMEAHAKHVDEWLGNWTTFTHRERMVANRFIMFYPFLRFSLKLTFQTLPAKHPIIASVAAKLGQLQHEELVKLGVDGLPWAGGRLYFTSNGKLKQVDMARANPLGNSLISIHQPSQLIGLLPPAASGIIDQLFHRSSFKDKEWAVQGKPPQFGQKGTDYGFRDRARIYTESLGKLAFPYREASKLKLVGPQGDDSSLLMGARPTKYKRESIVKAIEKTNREVEEKPVWARLLSDVLPFTGAESKDPDIAKSMEEKDKPAAKKPKGGSRFGGGSGGGGAGGRFGGSSGGSSGGGRFG